MQDRPNKIELLKGVEHFLADEAVAQLSGPARFHARVAARAVAMVVRELETEKADLSWEREALTELLDGAPVPASEPDATMDQVSDLNARLVELIKEGGADDPQFRKKALEVLRQAAVRKLAVNNTRMAELIREEWGME